MRDWPNGLIELQPLTECFNIIQINGRKLELERGTPRSAAGQRKKEVGPLCQKFRPKRARPELSFIRRRPHRNDDVRFHCNHLATRFPGDHLSPFFGPTEIAPIADDEGGRAAQA